MGFLGNYSVKQDFSWFSAQIIITLYALTVANEASPASIRKKLTFFNIIFFKVINIFYYICKKKIKEDIM